MCVRVCYVRACVCMQSAHGVETEEEVFDVLLAYGRQALDRFSSVVDSTSRQDKHYVTYGGINKYQYQIMRY